MTIIWNSTTPASTTSPEYSPYYSNNHSDAPSEARRRRPHTKSRAGCQNCKRRKVKCDEVKPCCGNCARFTIRCDFDPSPTPQETPLNNVASQCQLPVRRGRGRPRKAWPETPARTPSSTTAVSTPAASSDSDGPDAGAPPLDVLDLELMHHYMAHTAASLGDGLWFRENVPPVAFANPSVLRMLLVVSAQHLLYRNPYYAKREGLVALIDAHSSAALRDTTAILPHLSRDNCQVVYLATMLACFSAFAQGPARGHLLVIAGEGEVPWWVLMRGVRYILANFGFGAVYSGSLAQSSHKDDTQEPTIWRKTWQDVHWQAALEDISRLITLSTAAHQAHEDMYQTLLGKLTWCFESTFGTASDPRDANRGRFDVVMAWLFCAEDEYKQCVEERQPAALVLLAYFAVLLKSVEWYWFMEGWAAHIVGEVSGMLDGRYARYLDWPRSMVENWVAASGG